MELFMSEKAADLEIALLLPDVQYEQDKCLERLEASLQNQKGILRAHLERDKSPIDLCLHYDPNLLTLPEVKRIAERAGAHIVNRYHHESIPIEGMDCSDCGLVVEHSVGRMDGVLSVHVNYPAEKIWVEFDAHKVNRTAIEKRVRSLGYEIPLNVFQARLQENRELLFSILSGVLLLIGWLGGLVYLFTGIRQLQQLDDQLRTKPTSLLTRQFSANAVGIVAIIGLTGLYSAYLRVGDWYELLNSLYGHALLVKQGFVAGLLVIAATNLLIISPRLNRERIQGTANSKLVSSFGKILIVELTFAGLLLASVSFLTYIPPAKIAAPANTDFTSVKQADDLKVEMGISPARVGQNEFMLVLIASDGQPVYTAKEVLLRFTSNQANIPPSELQLVGDGSGMYMAQGAHLSFPGKWQVQAIVRRQDKFDVYANFDVTLRTPGSSDKTASSKQTGALLLSIGLLSVLITIIIKASNGIRFGLGVPLALLIFSLEVYYLTRPPILENSQANPIP